MKQVYDITLRAPGGQQRNQLQWFPTPAARTKLCERWRKRGIEMTINKQIL